MGNININMKPIWRPKYCQSVGDITEPSLNHMNDGLRKNIKVRNNTYEVT